MSFKNIGLGMGSRQWVMKSNIKYENLGKLIQNEPFRYIKGMVYIHFIIYIYICKDRPNIKKWKRMHGLVNWGTHNCLW